MKKLKLPVIDNFPERRKWLPMNEYIDFINFNFENFQRKKNAKRYELNMLVNVPFSIK